MPIVGWWIPSMHGETTQTVLLCPGLTSSKATELFMVRRLVDANYNVLAIDFRAHGQSGGQLISFGDLERRDVLSAVRWIHANHPKASQRLLGLGANTGAAALIAAAADPRDGQQIDAIAIYGATTDWIRCSIP